MRPPQLLTGVLALSLLAAGPATQPVDKNTTEYTAAPVKAHFRVPKLWARKDLAGTDPNVVFFFDPAPKKKITSLQLQQYVSVYIKAATDSQKTLEDVVKDQRALLEKMTPGVKFIKDAACTYAGRPAWMFHWIAKQKITGKMSDGTITTGYNELDRVKTVFLEHGTVCQFGLIADENMMPSLAQKAEPVAKTLSWE